MMSESTVCLINIGSRESRKRLILGATMVVAGIALGALLVLNSSARPARMILFLPFWAGALGLFQARRKT
jgi:hypothetical protein